MIFGYKLFRLCRGAYASRSNTAAALPAARVASALRPEHLGCLYVFSLAPKLQAYVREWEGPHASSRLSIPAVMSGSASDTFVRNGHRLNFVLAVAEKLESKVTDVCTRAVAH